VGLALLRGAGRAHLTIPPEAVDALPPEVKEGVIYHPHADRRRLHMGRDSVELRGRPDLLPALLACAKENAGRPLDGEGRARRAKDAPAE
jgi:hypothetical protein